MRGAARESLGSASCQLPEDVKAIAPDVLRHRILPSYEAEADGMDADAIVAHILGKVEMS